MRKGILLKLLSFVVVIVLLCMPVFARPRIKFLDDMINDIGNEMIVDSCSDRCVDGTLDLWYYPYKSNPDEIGHAASRLAYNIWNSFPLRNELPDLYYDFVNDIEDAAIKLLKGQSKFESILIEESSWNINIVCIMLPSKSEHEKICWTCDVIPIK